MPRSQISVCGLIKYLRNSQRLFNESDTQKECVKEIANVMFDGIINRMELLKEEDDNYLFVRDIEDECVVIKYGVTVGGAICILEEKIK
jgi:signal transduction histidine kinase